MGRVMGIGALRAGVFVPGRRWDGHGVRVCGYLKVREDGSALGCRFSKGTRGSGCGRVLLCRRELLSAYWQGVCSANELVIAYIRAWGVNGRLCPCDTTQAQWRCRTWRKACAGLIKEVVNT